MQYDPLKDRLSRLINLFPIIRKASYLALDVLLLRQRYVKRMIAKYMKFSDRLNMHDAGAGFCQYSYHILSKYPDSSVLASDLKSDYLEGFQVFADYTFPGRFTHQTADLQSYLPQGDFNLVTAIDILEHIPDDLAVLQNFHSSMKGDGILIISTPSDTDAAAFTEEHVRPGYNKADLEHKLGKAGFKIRESIYSYGPLGSLAWKLIIRNPLRLISKFSPAIILLPLYYLIVMPLAEILMHLDISLPNRQGTGIIIVAQK